MTLCGPAYCHHRLQVIMKLRQIKPNPVKAMRLRVICIPSVIKNHIPLLKTFNSLLNTATRVFQVWQYKPKETFLV